LVARAAYHYYGSSGAYGAAALAGLVDVDAITVTMSGLAHQGVLARNTAGGAILLAGAVNTLVKGGIAAWVGGPALRRASVPIFAAMTAATIAACVAMAHA
jgi:uncharacterized membrane protein (DUF4010 family)